jgi:peroxiredoxin
MTRRFVAVALLVTGSAALPVAAWRAVARTTRTEGLVRAAALPWSRVEGPWRADSIRRGPVALLFVQSRCPHCAPTARAFDTIVHATARQAVIVAADTGPAAVAFRATLGARTPIVADRERAVFRALGVTAVPTLVVIETDGHVRRLVGSVPSPMMRHFVADAP